MNEYETFYNMVKKWTVSDYRTQKIKAEVIVDTLISDYIENIVSQNLGKTIKLIAKEFPIARIGQPLIEKMGDKSPNRQYASVDFLMSAKEFDKPIIYLVELKTSDDSADDLQFLNMLWTCSQGSGSLYNRFYDIIMNYGIKDNGNDLSTKKYLYTLSKFGVNNNLEKFEDGIKSFGVERLGMANCPVKKEQTKTASDILNALKTLFDNANLKIVYVGLNNKINFVNMAKSAFNKQSIKEKIAKDNAVKKFFEVYGASGEIKEDFCKRINLKNIEKIRLTDFKPSKAKEKEWELVKKILDELDEEPLGKEWFDAKKLIDALD